MSSATIKTKDFEIELPIVEGSENEKAIDISSLRPSTGYITLDVGYGNTGSCESSITFIDGEKGILRYRGYPIEDLVRQMSRFQMFLICLFMVSFQILKRNKHLRNISEPMPIYMRI